MSSRSARSDLRSRANQSSTRIRVHGLRRTANHIARMRKLFFLNSMQVPAVLKNKNAIPGHSPGSVVVGLKDFQARRVLIRSLVGVVNIERDLDSVFSRNQR